MTPLWIAMGWAFMAMLSMAVAAFLDTLANDAEFRLVAAGFAGVAFVAGLLYGLGVHDGRYPVPVPSQTPAATTATGTVTP